MSLNLLENPRARRSFLFVVVAGRSVGSAIFCAALSTLLTLGACSTSAGGDAGSDGGVADLTPPPPSPDLTVFDLTPPPPPTLPQLNPHSATVLPSVQLTTITFVGYRFAPLAENLGDYIVTSSWIDAIGKEYGVGKGKHVKKVRLDPKILPDQRGITDAQVAKLVRDEITNGDLPPPDGVNSLYIVYTPQSIAVTQPDGNATCGGLGGYHNNSTVGGKHFAYGVVADCGGDFDAVSLTSAHEIGEAATDPYPNSGNNGFRLESIADGDPWMIENGEENGDMCNSTPYTPPDSSFVLQRCWSNAAAAASQDPCVPGQDPNYYNVTVTPVMPMVAAGATVEFQIQGWTTGKKQVPPWTISVSDAARSPYSVGMLKPQLSTTTMYDGHTGTIKITVPADASPGDVGGVLIQSGPPTYFYSRQHVWPVAFTVQ